MKIDEKTINDKHFVESVRRELARRSFYGFIYYLKPDYIFSNFANSIISEIELFLQEVRKGKRPILILQAPPQHGKALKIDTPILTPDGFKAHGDLKVGDIVFNDKGEQVRVLANSGAYEWDIRELIFSNGVTIDASPEHLWVLKEKGEIISTKQIQSLLATADYIELISSYEKNKDIIHGFHRWQVVEVRKKARGLVNCIQVEGSIYLAGRELIPTHNSELVSRLLPAYLLGKYSKMRIAGASYSQDLATAMNKDIQRYMQSSEYQELFPNSSLGKVNRLNSFNAEKITIFNKRNYYLASSVGGALTGKSVDIGIIDDPIKNMQEARSPATRRTIESWYKAVFLTRLSKRCGQIIMMTRWHEEDLIGTILKNKNLCQNIKVLSYPAINDKQEALVPELHPLSQLEEIRAVMSEYEWQAMYMQHPISDVGNVFKWQDFTIVPSSFISSLHFDYTFITADTAMKTKEMNDYTVYTAWGFDKSSNKLYMLDMYRDKVESIEREEQARIFYNRNAKFPFKAMFIEDKVSGTDLGQRLKNGDKRLNLKPLIIRMIERKADKITRAFEVLPYLSTYSIAINENIKYIEDIKQEINGFPYAPHDDIVDTIIDGLQVAYGKKEGVDYTNLYKGLSMR